MWGTDSRSENGDRRDLPGPACICFTADPTLVRRAFQAVRAVSRRGSFQFGRGK